MVVARAKVWQKVEQAEAKLSCKYFSKLVSKHLSNLFLIVTLHELVNIIMAMDHISNHTGILWTMNNQ